MALYKDALLTPFLTAPLVVVSDLWRLFVLNGQGIRSPVCRLRLQPGNSCSGSALNLGVSYLARAMKN